MRTFALFIVLAIATNSAIANENKNSIQGIPKLMPIHRHGGTVVKGGIAMSGDRYGCELLVRTDSGTYVFDWIFKGSFDFEEDADYRFILSVDRRSLREIRNLDDDVEWKANTALRHREARLLRIHFADPTLISG